MSGNMIPPEHREVVLREVQGFMSKLRDSCEPKTVEGWRELCESYDKELAQLESQVAELQDGRCTLNGRPDFKAFADALRAEARWEETVKRGDRTGQLSTDVRQLTALADQVERVASIQGYL